MSDKLIEYQDYKGNILYFHSKSDIVQYTNSAFTNVDNVKGALDYISNNFTSKVGRGVEKGTGDNSVISVNAEVANTATKNGVALGTGLKAGNYHVVVGKLNSSLVGSELNAQYGDAFAVGNGTSNTNRSNAFRVSMSGNVYSGGVYNTGGADFAEMYEWVDGNPNNEERRGRFVTLDGDKIRFATENDQIIGITSATPCIVGNNHEDWHERYVTDVFGGIVYEKVNITTDDGKLIETYRKKVNPDYDPARAYILRSERKEWAYVGQLGQIVVCDDGTCEVNGYCHVAGDGYAKASEKGWRVLKRIDGSHVLMLFYLK
ncbi:MAG TPA: hypothetical protein DCW90_19005 [Lachnospiraceae bacterium]|nr:hypothetical protein [Lachnospiraceae bacterium]